MSLSGAHSSNDACWPKRTSDLPGDRDPARAVAGPHRPSTFGGAPIEKIGRLVLARSREASGDLAGAVTLFRRRPYHHMATTYLPTTLCEERRLAAPPGDRTGAVPAYRRYLALRADPEPPLRAQVAQVPATWDAWSGGLAAAA